MPSIQDLVRQKKKGLEIKELTKEVEEVKEKKKEFKKKLEKEESDKKLIIPSEIRFYGMIASALGIKNYGSLPLAQLKLKISNKLAEESGLV